MFDTSTLQLSERWKWKKNYRKIFKVIEKEQMITLNKINQKIQNHVILKVINMRFQNKVVVVVQRNVQRSTPNNKENKIEGERENLQLT